MSANGFVCLQINYKLNPNTCYLVSYSICPIVYTTFACYSYEKNTVYSILHSQPIPGDLGYVLNENFTIWMNPVDISLV